MGRRKVVVAAVLTGLLLLPAAAHAQSVIAGVARDATGSYRAGLIGGSVLAMLEGALILYLRASVIAERRGRALALEQMAALPL